MSAHDFNLRGIDGPVFALLKKESAKQKISINKLITKLIEQALGYSHVVRRPTYHDLDNLAGTWSEKDAAEFKKNTAYFEQIDIATNVTDLT